jgi:UDP-N-acetylglucosamine--N-acetylmuramyl-(pentapeptide) pyrophosphoryl-undecaprenol N-acetylglucosamine transferase
MEAMMKVIISGGGTGGHINPGILIAKKIVEKEPETSIKFIGTQRGLEKELVPRAGFDIEYIRAKGIKRKLSFENLKVLGELGLGFFDAIKIIKTFKPDVIIGTGGYVCAPVMLGATFLGIPFVLHESNALPGVTNKGLARFASKILIGFKEAKSRFSQVNKVVFTGNPVAYNDMNIDKIVLKKKLGVDIQKPLVCVTGGSQGAKAINKSIVDMIIASKGKINYTLYFATGNLNYQNILEKLKENDINLENLPNINIFPYIYNMNEVMGASDLLIGRAGAMTVSEICVNGTPSILIPLPTAAENHQEYNARALEKQGASVVILEKDLNYEIISKKIEEIIYNKQTLNNMSEKARENGVMDATENIYEIIKEVAKKR